MVLYKLLLSEHIRPARTNLITAVTAGEHCNLIEPAVRNTALTAAISIQCRSLLV